MSQNVLTVVNQREHTCVRSLPRWAGSHREEPTREC
jgi:hypothetical protein